jgi:rfaE bifunctional protein kinase chain/domain
VWDEQQLRTVVSKLPHQTIAVVGDFFLDRYLDIDARLTEKSVETGLDAYQVVAVRNSPGAGGTVTNNLAALGVGRVVAVSVVGEDGEGFDLKRELGRRGIDASLVIESPQRRTPTYTKPMLADGSGPARELNRIDIKNRQPAPAALVREIARRLDEVVAEADAVVVADQVSEPECGVMTVAIRERLAELALRHPNKVIIADSRDRIGQYHNVIAKPNQSECLRAVARPAGAVDPAAVRDAAAELARRTGRPVFCTLGAEGILAADPASGLDELVPASAVSGPIDIVGAGDSATAGIVCALCCGANLVDAAALGNLVASITIQQIGTTGTATPEQVIARWREVEREFRQNALRETGSGLPVR